MSPLATPVLAYYALVLCVPYPGLGHACKVESTTFTTLAACKATVRHNQSISDRFLRSHDMRQRGWRWYCRRIAHSRPAETSGAPSLRSSAG